MASSVSSSAASSSGQASGPLFVDLDGTLLATNSLWEGLRQACLRSPGQAWQLPWRLLRGRAAFKQAVASVAELDPAALPYRAAVLAVIAIARSRGRPIVLATGADAQVAHAVAAHVGGFDAVLSSDGDVNLTGGAKLAAMRRHAAGSEFGYIGDSVVDFPIFDAVVDGYLVDPSVRTARRAARLSRPPQLVGRVDSRSGAIRDTLRAHQWAKNSLLLVPALLSHMPWTWPAALTMAIAFTAFCLAASSVYVVNDVLDLTTDRAHPDKSGRPIARGVLGLPQAMALAGICFIGSLSLAVVFLPRSFAAVLLVYMLISHLYSIRLKRTPILDVFILAGLYSMRLVAGGVARVAISTSSSAH